MSMILLFTSVLMWVLAILTTICLLRLLRETNKLKKELEEQRKELENVEVCVYRGMKEQNGWHAVLCTDERRK